MEDEVALGRLEVRMTTVEREIAEIKRKSDDHHTNDTQRWDNFLINFGALQAKVEKLDGRMAGYLLAGMLLAAVVAVIAQVMLKVS